MAHLAGEFRERGHEVHVVAPSSDGDPEPGDFDDPFMHRIGRVVPIPANGSVARITLSLRSYLQAKALLRAHRFDLIHLHEPLMPALPLTVLRHSDSTNIGTFHAFNTTGLNYFYGKAIVQPFFKKLHGHIAVSPAARDYVSTYFRGDYRVIPNGIEFQRFNRPLPPIERFNDGRPNVLFVGRLEKRKGLRFLLRAWQQVREGVPAARLIVVGRGRPLEGYRRFALRQGWLDDDVHFAGFVTDDDLPRYYQSAAVFCAPNTGQESFGIVLLEAMAAGTPIVASDIPGFRSVVSHGQDGLLVTPKDSAALAESIGALLQNPGLRDGMRQAGRRKAEQFDWVHIADDVMAYYVEILQRRLVAAEAQTVGVRWARMRRMVGLSST